MATKTYACENCGFLFKRVEEIKSCPDCGKKNIRLATEKEIEELENRLKENDI